MHRLARAFAAGIHKYGYIYIRGFCAYAILSKSHMLAHIPIRETIQTRSEYTMFSMYLLHDFSSRSHKLRHLSSFTEYEMLQISHESSPRRQFTQNIRPDILWKRIILFVQMSSAVKRIVDATLTLCVLMDSSFWSYTINVGYSIMYISRGVRL